MSKQTKDVTFFNFKGGLNTDDHVLSVNPNFAKDMTNFKINSDGSVESRKNFDYVGTNSTGLLGVPLGLDCTTINKTGTFQYPCSGSTVFSFATSKGVTINTLVTQVGAAIYINRFDDLSDIGAQDLTSEIHLFAGLDQNAYIYKTKFMADSARLYLINPFIPFCYIEYDEDNDVFNLQMAQLYERDFDNRSTINDAIVKHNGQRYKCIQDHDPLTENEPGVGSKWPDFWELDGPESGTEAAWALLTKVANVYIINTSTETVSGGEVPETISIEVYDYYTLAQAHTSSTGNKPPNTLYWSYVGRSKKTSASLFGTRDAAPWPGYYEWAAGTAYSGNNNTYQSNVTKITWESDSGYDLGVRAGAFAGGRMWLGNVVNNPNRLYFSRSLTGKDEYYNFFFQYADPWNRDDSDIVDTDGGFIEITEATAILEIKDYAKGVLVFATNGVWYVSGPSGVFRANDYSIEKISDDGCISASGVTAVGENIVYAGLSDIFVIKANDVSGEPETALLTDNISNFWKDISKAQKQALHMAYNRQEKRIYIGINLDPLSQYDRASLSPGGGVASVAAIDYASKISTNPSIFTDILVYDVTLNAWYKYNVNSAEPRAYTASTTGTNYYYDEWATFLTDIVPVEVSGAQKLNTVTTNLDNVIVTSGAEVAVRSNATTNFIGANIYPTIARFGFVDDLNTTVTQTDNVWFTFAYEADYGDTDFPDIPNISVNSPMTTMDLSSDFHDNCFIETFPISFGDIAKFKQIPYLHTLFKRIEESTTNGVWDIGCGATQQVLWNWAKDIRSTGLSNLSKYGTAYSAYKPNLLPTFISDDTNDTNVYTDEYVLNRHRIRGRGKSLAFRFAIDKTLALPSSEYKVHLIGWQVGLEANK